MIPPELFYQQITRLAALSPYDRYARLAKFHTELTMRYLSHIRSMTADDAAQVGQDGRTVGQLVAHIAEWERYTIMAAAEMITGSPWPQIMTLSGYLPLAGQIRSFDNVDEFNAYQTRVYATRPWPEIKEMALHTATALHSFFTQPTLLSPDTLQRTRNHEWRLPTGLKLTQPAGWYLWMVTLEHESVAHAADLGWSL